MRRQRAASHGACRCVWSEECGGRVAADQPRGLPWRRAAGASFPAGLDCSAQTQDVSCVFFSHTSSPGHPHRPCSPHPHTRPPLMLPLCAPLRVSLQSLEVSPLDFPDLDEAQQIAELVGCHVPQQPVAGAAAGGSGCGSRCGRTDACGWRPGMAEDGARLRRPVPRAACLTGCLPACIAGEAGQGGWRACCARAAQRGPAERAAVVQGARV